jgi:hypothetical protein
LTDVVRVKVPDVPVTVNVLLDFRAALPAENVSVELPSASAGANWATTPAGTPATVRLTCPSPPRRVIVIVVLALEPRRTLTDAGFAVSEKSGATTDAAATTTLAFAVRTSLLLSVAVIVSGYVAAAALAGVAMVIVDELEIGFWLKVTTDPAGGPVTARSGFRA